MYFGSGAAMARDQRGVSRSAADSAVRPRRWGQPRHRLEPAGPCKGQHLELIGAAWRPALTSVNAACPIVINPNNLGGIKIAPDPARSVRRDALENEIMLQTRNLENDIDRLMQDVARLFAYDGNAKRVSILSYAKIAGEKKLEAQAQQALTAAEARFAIMHIRSRAYDSQ